MRRRITRELAMIAVAFVPVSAPVAFSGLEVLGSGLLVVGMTALFMSFTNKWGYDWVAPREPPMTKKQMLGVCFLGFSFFSTSFLLVGSQKNMNYLPLITATLFLGEGVFMWVAFLLGRNGIATQIHVRDVTEPFG